MTYKCEKCKNQVGQIIFNKESKKWECADCMFGKEELDLQDDKSIL